MHGIQLETIKNQYPFKLFKAMFITSPTLTWIYLEEVVLILDTLVTGMKPGMDTEMREDTSVIIHQGFKQISLVLYKLHHFEGVWHQTSDKTAFDQVTSVIMNREVDMNTEVNNSPCLVNIRIYTCACFRYKLWG